MNILKNFFKKTNNKYLRPLREQICELIPKNASVIDVGCGYGTQLKMLAPKISYGLGIDNSKKKIDFASNNLPLNLEFKVLDFDNLDLIEKKFDYAILTMVIHTLNCNERESLFEKIPANKLIVADCVKSKSKIRNSLMCFEEMFCGHYFNFRSYLNLGKIGKEIETFDSAIKIWIS